MLSFRKGSYNLHELTVMRNALTDGATHLECNPSGCDTCHNRKPCRDINQAIVYLDRLITEYHIRMENGV